MKKPLFFLIILMVLPAFVYAGFHLGMADAVKKKVENPDEKVTEKQEEREEAEKAIKQLYATWESSFESKNITTLMSCYSDNYLHNGDSHWESKFDLTGPNFGDPDGYVDVWDLMVFADNWHEGEKP